MEKRSAVENAMRQHVALSPMALVGSSFLVVGSSLVSIFTTETTALGLRASVLKVGGLKRNVCIEKPVGLEV